MNERLVKAQDVILEKINQICSRFGLNNVMAQLYTVLYLSKSPLSLDDMVEQLKISKGSVSINIRALERYGAVRRVWIRGSRRDYYEAQTNISKVIMDRVKSMAQRQLSEIDDMLNQSRQILNSIDACDQEEEETVKVFKQRLGRLKSLHNQAKILFNLFNSGLLNQAVNSKNRRGRETRADRVEISI